MPIRSIPYSVTRPLEINAANSCLIYTEIVFKRESITPALVSVTL